VLWPQDLGPQHALVEVELAVELLDGARLRGEVDDGVDAFRLLVDLVGKTALSPDVKLAGWTVRSSRFGSRMIMTS
jgi:hypothetical protein